MLLAYALYCTTVYSQVAFSQLIVSLFNKRMQGTECIGVDLLHYGYRSVLFTNWVNR